jgi:hypothetical protein
LYKPVGMVHNESAVVKEISYSGRNWSFMYQ